MMSNYRKFWAAVVGIGILLTNRYAGLDLGPVSNDIVDIIIAVSTVIGVERLPNTPSK